MSNILKSVSESARALHEAGVMDEKTMRDISEQDDERIEKIEWAATQAPYAWLAKTALEVIRELQEERAVLQHTLDNKD